MEFTSFVCGLFIALVFALYWFAARWKATGQNLVLLVASAVFYALADHRFLLLLLLSAAANYGLAIGIDRSATERNKRILFYAGVVLDLGLLCWFKYFDFFRTGVFELLHTLGFSGTHHVLAIALPLGISFYTFQMLGYLIDVRNEETTPCKDPLAFFTYVLFFPKMMAGPIERAQRFLPQIADTRKFDGALAVDGLRQILWGLLAKVVIADNASTFVDIIFAHPGTASSSTLLVGAFLYFIQIYCDFSGYSNMAIGMSKLFGIRLMTNFSAPFFATSISDFWKKWHISLSSWMIDHVFTPLSFVLRARGKLGTVISISATFLAVGIWHGANWTFVVFGVLQSLYFLPLALASSVTRASTFISGNAVPSAKHAGRMLGMFVLMMLTFVLLRAPDIHTALVYYHGLLNTSILTKPRVFPSTVILFAALFVLAEWFQRGRSHALENFGANLPAWLRWTVYLVILYVIILFSNTGSYQFIYFQF